LEKMLQLFVMISILISLPTYASEIENLAPKYSPTDQDLSEESLDFKEITHHALLGWQLSSFIYREKEGVYSEECEYVKGSKIIRVKVLEFPNEFSAITFFEDLREKAISSGDVPSREFGDEGFVTSEKSRNRPYRNVFRLGRFVVHVERVELASAYEIKMMARWMMFNLQSLVEPEREDFILGPIRIGNYQFYPYLEADSQGLRIVAFNLYIPKPSVIILITVVLSSFIALPVVILFLKHKVMMIILSKLKMRGLREEK